MAQDLIKKIEEVFSLGGPLSKATDNYRPRESQVAFAKAVGNTLKTKETVIIEAGTGTGKTFAYLVPALLHSGRVLISTAGKTLQDQLFEKDIPALLNSLGIGCKVALLKGRSNYICKLRLENAYSENVAKSREEVVHLNRIKVYAMASDTGERAGVTDVPENSGIWPSVTSTAENCLGSKCAHYEDCFVMKAREKAKESDIVVVNHHIFLADISLKEEDVVDFLPNFDLIVFDEAHQLVEVATSFFADELSLRDIRSMVQDGVVAGYRVAARGPDWNDLGRTLNNMSDDLVRLLQEITQRTEGQWAVKNFKECGLLVDPFRNLLSAAENFKAAFSQYREADAEMEKVSERADEICKKISYWADVFAEGPAAPAGGGKVHWFTLRPKSATFTVTPLSFAETFSKARSEQGKPWVLTSATLAVGDSFEHFTKRLGMEDATTYRWSSPFNYHDQGLLYVPANLPDPGAADFYERVAQSIWPLIKRNGGRAFVLCTTLRAMDLISEQLRYFNEQEEGAIKVLVQNEAPKQELIRRFRSRPGSVLVGSMSFWEGVDIKGDALSMVVIDKIPFPPPDDPVIKGRSDEMQARGENPFGKIFIPAAALHLQQGAGRLIRDSSDMGLLVITDPRLLSRSYGRSLWGSLPNFQRTSNLEIAEDFIDYMVSERNKSR